MAAAPANYRFFLGGGERPTLRHSGGASRGPPGTTISNGVPTKQVADTTSRIRSQIISDAVLSCSGATLYQL